MHNNNNITNWQLIIQKIADTRGMSWINSKMMHHLDRFFMRISSGKFSLSNFLTGVPIIMLTTRGAHSGISRVIPLVGIHDGKNYIIIASNWGKHQLPGWYYNLKANPIADITTNRASQQYHSREVDESEYPVYWKTACEIYPGYKNYLKLAKRNIPIVLLEPMNVNQEEQPNRIE